jgi:hypothetical protein
MAIFRIFRFWVVDNFIERYSLKIVYSATFEVNKNAI